MKRRQRHNDINFQHLQLPIGLSQKQCEYATEYAYRLPLQDGFITTVFCVHGYFV